MMKNKRSTVRPGKARPAGLVITSAAMLVSAVLIVAAITTTPAAAQSPAGGSALHGLVEQKMTILMGLRGMKPWLPVSQPTGGETERDTGHAARGREPVLEGDLTLAGAVQWALYFNKTLQATLLEQEVARGRLADANAARRPKVSTVGSYTRRDEVGGFDIGGRSVSLGYQNNYSAGLQAVQPLATGGAIEAGLRAAELGAVLTGEQVRGAVQGTIFAVAGNYFEIQLARRLCAIYEDSLKSAEGHATVVEQRLRQGMASRFDLLRAQVEVSNITTELIRQRNRLHLADVRLLKTMGVSQDSTVTLTDGLAYVPAAPDLDEALTVAFGNRPDLKAAELGIGLQEEQLAIARSRYRPAVSAVLTQNWQRPDPHATTLDEWDDIWTAVIKAEWALYDGKRVKDRFIKEETGLRQKRIQFQEARETILLDLKQAVLNIQDAEQAVETQQLNLGRADEGLRLAEEGYRQGINTMVEVTDARAALTQAQGIYYQAVFGHLMARLGLKLAMGVLGPRAGEETIPAGSTLPAGYLEGFCGPDDMAPAAGTRRGE